MKTETAIMDLPRAFLHTKLEGEDEMIMVMKVRLAELMVSTEPNNMRYKK